MIRHASLLSLALALSAATAVFADPPKLHVISQSSAVIEPGDTLDSLLGRAGLPPTQRAEVALALSGVYDLTDLRPCYRLEWTADPSDAARLLSLSLFIEDGAEITLSFVGAVKAERLDPPIREVDRRETLALQGSLFDALVARNAPELFKKRIYNHPGCDN